MEFSEMKRLASKFLTLAHPQNPVVDTQALHLLIRQVLFNLPRYPRMCSMGFVDKT